MDEQKQLSQPQNEQKRSLAADFYDWAYALLQAVIGVLLVFALGFSIYSVKGTSMDNTLKEGQMLMISRLFYTPAHDDIVMFTEYGVPEGYNIDTGRYSPFVKRVIGLPGDHIELKTDGIQSLIYVNGEVKEEAYIPEAMNPISADRAWDVPEGTLFVMGDNRNHSLDSRYAEVSFVDQRFVLGRVLVRLVPVSKFGKVKDGVKNSGI